MVISSSILLLGLLATSQLTTIFQESTVSAPSRLHLSGVRDQSGGERLTVMDRGEVLEEVEVIERRDTGEGRYVLFGANWLDREQYERFGLKLLSIVTSSERGGFGVQEDLSIAGATFEQNLVLIEGLRITDLQTGHHLLNLPLTPSDISGVEVVTGGLSSLYGSGGFGGAVNYYINPSKKEGLFRFGLGSYDYREGFLKFGLPLSSKILTISLNYRSSTGHTTNRDFDIRDLNFYHKDRRNLIYYGFTERDFGAKYFYTPRFDSEWESVRTHLFLIKRVFGGSGITFEPGMLLRKNYDYYLLFRDRPQLYNNRHRSTLFRADLPLTISTRGGLLRFGLDLGYETLTSSRLGDYLRRNISPYLSWEIFLSKRLLTLLSLRYDNFFLERDLTTISSSLIYLPTENLTLGFSAYGTSRLPSVTELRYEALGIRGNPELLPEKATGMELSLDITKKSGKLWAKALFRKGYDLIDWFNSGTGTIARNLNADTVGLNVGLDWTLRRHRLFFSYTYLNHIGKDLLYSRYLGNYLRHNLQIGVSLDLPEGLKINPHISYQKRYRQDGKVLINFNLEKRLTRNLTFYLWGRNLLNEKYYEIKYHEAGRGVEGIPMWIGAGLKIGIDFNR